MDTTALDSQMGDLVWCFYNALRAGFNLPQVFAMLSKEAPEPVRGASQSFFDDLCANVPGAKEMVKWSDISLVPINAPLNAPLERWKKAYPSSHVARVADKILEYQQVGSNLADLLEPLEAEFIQQSGSDPAFYPAMRVEARNIGAKLPERAKADSK